MGLAGSDVEAANTALKESLALRDGVKQVVKQLEETFSQRKNVDLKFC